MDWQKRLQLEAHPEGGSFRRIHTAAAEVRTAAGVRRASSAIHYLLTAAEPKGRFHRVRSTILHFLQSGGPVQYACITADGELQETTLGFANGQLLFLEVPADTWKCSRLVGPADHALVSEVVIPGFDWQDHRYLGPDDLPASLQQRLRASGWLAQELQRSL